MRALLMGYVFLLVLALYPYTHNPAGPIKQLITDWALLLIAPLCVADALFAGGALRWRSPLAALLAVFLLVHLASALASESAAHGLVELRRWLGLSLLALYTAHACRTPAHVRRLAGVMVLAVALSSLYGLYQASGLPDPFPWGQKDVEEYFGLPATYANPNFAAHTLVIALILAAGLARSQPLYIAPGLLIGVHLYLTSTRGPRVAVLAALALVGIAALVCRREARPARAAWVTLMTSVIVAAVALAGLLAAYRTGIVSRRGGAGESAEARGADVPLDSSLLLRYNGYYGAARMALDKPPLGFGPGQYALHNAAYWTEYEQYWFATTGKKNMHVHNDLLETAVETGVPGAAVYIALLVWALLQGLALAAVRDDPDRRRLGMTLAACVCVFAVDGFFGFNARVPVSSGLFFMLLGGLDALAPGRAMRRSASVTVASVAGIAALVSAYYGTQWFAAERHLQTAEFARYGSEQYAARGDNAAAAAVRRKAYEALARGAALASWDTRFPQFMALLDLRRGDNAGAVKRLVWADQEDCRDVQALLRLARARVNIAVLARESQPERAARAREDAARVLDRLERLCPPLSDLWDMRAALAATQAHDADSWRVVAEHLNRALVYGARDRAGLQQRIALAWANAGAVDEAERAFRQAAELRPDDPELWRVYHGFARECDRRACFLDALHAAAERLARAQPPQAATLSEIAWHQAVVYREAGEVQLARTVIDAALDRDPASLPLWGELSIVMDRSTRNAALAKRAVSAIARLEAERRTPPEALGLLAALDVPTSASLLAGGEKLAALARSPAFGRDADAVQRTLSWIGDLYIDSLQSAAMTPVDQAAFLAAMGELFVWSGRWEAAHEVFAAAMPGLDGAKRATALAHYSEALARLGRAAEALDAARQAAAEGGEQMLTRHMLARRLAESGRAAEARFEYKALLQKTAASSALYAVLEAELAALERGQSADAGAGGSP